MNTQLQLSIELAPAYLLSLSIAYTDVNRRRCGGWKDNIQKGFWILGFGTFRPLPRGSTPSKPLVTLLVVLAPILIVFEEAFAVTGAVLLQHLVACKLCLIRPGVSSGVLSFG
jgi:hypothetical protein